MHLRHLFYGIHTNNSSCRVNLYRFFVLFNLFVASLFESRFFSIAVFRSGLRWAFTERGAQHAVTRWSCMQTKRSHQIQWYDHFLCAVQPIKSSSASSACANGRRYSSSHHSLVAGRNASLKRLHQQMRLKQFDAISIDKQRNENRGH